MIVRVIKSLMVCTSKKLNNFTYGRVYRFIDDPDIYDTGYNWVVNDKKVISAVPISSFRTIEEFKEQLEKMKLNENLK
jgi:predicted aspartyl protease